jgi:hypothetical protein
MTGLLIVHLSMKEIERFAQELIHLIEPLSQEDIWTEAHGIPNSIGKLLQHLTGNLNHYFGAGVLKNGYVRDRDHEFTNTNLAKDTLIVELETAVSIAREAAKQIDDELIRQPYTTPCGQHFESFAYHAIRLATHFALHLGQVDYAIHSIHAE